MCRRIKGGRKIEKEETAKKEKTFFPLLGFHATVGNKSYNRKKIDFEVS